MNVPIPRVHARSTSNVERALRSLHRRIFVNSSRYHLDRLNRAFAQTIPAGSLVLDAGAGDQLYRPLLSHTRYEAADFELVDKPYAKSTYVCDLTSIPVDSERFDYIVCNQVLEHLPEPLSALIELNRVLKPGGRAFFTMPLFYEEHEKPYDFYRYTQFGHRYLFDRAGFSILRLEWMEGYFGTVAYQLETACRYLPLRPSQICPGWRGFAALPIVAAAKLGFAGLSALFYRLDMRFRFTGRGFPKNYAVIATK